MGDQLALILIVLSFASLVTAHVTIALALSSRQPRWRAWVALLVPPLAPFWAARSQMRGRATLWVVALVGYVVARVLLGG